MAHSFQCPNWKDYNPKNFTLSKDFIKQAVERFTTWKTMEVVHEMLGLEL